MSVEENKALVRRWFEACEAASTHEAAQFLAPDFVCHLPGSWPDVRGRKGWQSHADTLRAAFADIRHDIEDMIAEGDRVAVRYTARMIHQGEFGGFPPTGKEVVNPVMLSMIISDGRISEMWAFFDNQYWMQQLGAVPPPGEGGNE